MVNLEFPGRPQNYHISKNKLKVEVDLMTLVGVREHLKIKRIMFLDVLTEEAVRWMRENKEFCVKIYMDVSLYQAKQSYKMRLVGDVFGMNVVGMKGCVGM